MWQLSQLPSLVTKRKRRLGRGPGSGRGKTAGRGTKGQKARGNIRVGFEGGQLPLIKRLPLYRGRGKNRGRGEKLLPINLEKLNVIPDGSEVTLVSLLKYKVVKEKRLAGRGVKILGNGRLTRQLTIKLPISKSAQAKVEKAGGKVEIGKPKVPSAKS